VFLLFSITLFSQHSNFKLDENSPISPNQYVILNVDTLSVRNAYYKTLKWIRLTYSSSDEVLKAQLDDKYIKIEGSGKLYYAQALGVGNFYKTKYYITISFKKGEVKFEVTKMAAYFPPTDLTSGRWAAVTYQNKDVFKSNGKLRKNKIKNYNVTLRYFNDLSKSLKNYLITTSQDKSIEFIF
jgi:hypothetical protein